MPISYKFTNQNGESTKLTEVDDWLCKQLDLISTDTDYGYVHIAGMYGTSALCRISRLNPEIYSLTPKCQKEVEEFLMEIANEALKDGRWGTSDQAMHWVFVMTEALCTRWHFSAWR